ncbi:ArsC family reductase [Segnochrobactraceae bacterium EtOH-i3]
MTTTGPVTIYGIRTCDTMKKARTWLETHGIAARFHDYRVDGLDPVLLAGWVDALGWEALLNRSGTTFRKLPEGDKTDLTREKAIALMLAQPAMIRRPVLDAAGRLTIGFKPEIYAALFGK